MVTMPRPPDLPAPPPPTPLNPGATLSIDDGATWLDPTHLAGGSPFRIMGLSPAGVSLVGRWGDGEPLGDDPAHGALARRLVDGGLVHPTFAPSPGLGRVTVVIPVRDRAEELDALLARLDGLDAVVVDDGSVDASRIAAIADQHGARLHRRPTSGGPGVARNEGLGLVTTEFACFVDSDCEPPEGFVTHLLPALQDPRVALVAPRIAGRLGNGLLERFEQACSPLDVGRRPALVRPGGATTFVPSACMLLRTSLGPQLFDEDLVGGEDVDLVWRLAAAGWSIRLDPCVIVGHPARPTLASWLSQRSFYGSTAAALSDRHGDAVAPIAGSAFTVVAWGATLLGWPIAGLASLVTGTAILSRRLDGTIEHHRSAAARLMVRSSLGAGPTLARQVVRSYAPGLLVLALVSRRVRRASIATALLGAIGRWWSADTDLDPGRFVALSLLDDAAYSTGLWAGVVRRRRAGALRPRLSLMRPSDRGANGADQS